MDTVVTTLTERGQISLPARFRKQMGLRPGQALQWKLLSKRECLVSAPDPTPVRGPKAMLGYARQLNPGARRSTAHWLRELRGGEA